LSEFIPLSEVLNHKIGEFLCWPEYNSEIVADRIKQLESLGVESIAVGGPHNIQGTQVLGKGHTGVVLRAKWQGKEVALKVRRTDADRESMEREARFLSHVNKWGLGPVLHGFISDFIVMEKIVGHYLGEWVKDNKENKQVVKKNLRKILDITWRLDQSGLDHGELTRIRRHYIVTNSGPRVIDFESASFDRSPRNVTCTVQSLFMNYNFSKLLSEVINLPENEKLLKVLRKYKQEKSEENYLRILEIVNLSLV
jgi:putative serine/threonine protein kinase